MRTKEQIRFYLDNMPCGIDGCKDIMPYEDWFANCKEKHPNAARNIYFSNNIIGKREVSGTSLTWG